MFNPKAIKEKYGITLRSFSRGSTGFSPAEFLYDLGNRKPLISDTWWSADMKRYVLDGDVYNGIGSPIIRWYHRSPKELTLFYPEGRALESCKLLEEYGVPDFKLHPSYRWYRMVDSALAGHVSSERNMFTGRFTWDALPDGTPIMVRRSTLGDGTVYVKCSIDYLSEHIRIVDLVPVVEAMFRMLGRPSLPFED